jgi:4-amino-4-deoxy-L-arabinose transferase-like glycosyltransferase
MAGALLGVHAVVVAIAAARISRRTGDTGYYLELADNLLRAGRFGLGDGAYYAPEGWRLPGYPLFLAICRALFGPSEWPVVPVQGVLFIGSVVLVWYTARRLFGPKVALAFLLVSACYPFVGAFAAQLTAETLCVFLVALSVALLAHPTSTRVVAAGVVVGLAAYVRPNILPLSVCLALALVLADRTYLRRAIGLVAAAALVVLPWAVRNFYTFDRFTPGAIPSGTGTSLFLASWTPKVSQPALIKWGMGKGPSAEIERAGMLAQVRAANREIGVSPETVPFSLESYPTNALKMRADDVLRRQALRNIQAWPVAYATSVIMRMGRMWFTVYTPMRLPEIVRTALILCGLLVLVAGITGAVLALRTVQAAGRPALYGMLACIAFYTVSHSIFHTEARYTIPVRLFLVCLAALALTRLAEHLAAQARTMRGRPGAAVWGSGAVRSGHAGDVDAEPVATIGR